MAWLSIQVCVDLLYRSPRIKLIVINIVESDARSASTMKEAKNLKDWNTLHQPDWPRPNSVLSGPPTMKPSHAPILSLPTTSIPSWQNYEHSLDYIHEITLEYIQ